MIHVYTYVKLISTNLNLLSWLRHQKKIATACFIYETEKCLRITNFIVWWKIVNFHRKFPQAYNSNKNTHVYWIYKQRYWLFSVSKQSMLDFMPHPLSLSYRNAGISGPPRLTSELFNLDSDGSVTMPLSEPPILRLSVSEITTIAFVDNWKINRH